MDEYQLCALHQGTWDFGAVSGVGKLTCITGVPHLGLVIAGSSSGTLVMATVNSKGKITSIAKHKMHSSGDYFAHLSKKGFFLAQ